MNYKKIILIKPPLNPEEEFGDLHNLGSCEPPIGLCYLAANLKKNNIEVAIIDAIAQKLSYTDVVNKIIKSGFLLIGYSSETTTVCNAAKLARLVKKEQKRIINIIGGPHVTALPMETMKSFPQFDFGVIGEGEISLVELVNNIINNKNCISIPGIIIRNGEKIIITQKRKVEQYLDSLPFPAWNLLPSLPDHYHLSSYSLKKTPSISLITSRGCGYSCTYCFQGVFGKSVRKHSALYIKKMILELYHRYGIREIRFQDDIFMTDEKRLITFCNILINENLNISWSCLSRADKVKKATLELMKKAGCWQILIGIESGSQKILNEINKNLSLKQIEIASRLINNAKIESVGYFIIGYPSETKKTIKETILFAKKIPLKDFRMNFLVPFPGTAIYQTAKRCGKLTKKWSEMNFFKEPCYIPDNFSKKDIIFYRRMAFIQFYLRPRILLFYFKNFIKNPYQSIIFFKGGVILLKYIIKAFWARKNHQKN